MSETKAYIEILEDFIRENADSLRGSLNLWLKIKEELRYDETLYRKGYWRYSKVRPKLLKRKREIEQSIVLWLIEFIKEKQNLEDTVKGEK